MNKRVGIYGGTFAPPHLGHINAARAFLNQCKLDELLIIPSGIPPHKEVKFDYSSQERMELCKLSFDFDRRITVSDIEISRGGVSYSYNTVLTLMSEGEDLFFLVGTDMLLTFDTWNEFRSILSMVTLCCIKREMDPGTALLFDRKVEYFREEYDANIIVIDAPITEMSSTLVRRAIARGVDLTGMLCDSAKDYVLKRETERKKILSSLRDEMSVRLSEKRFLHTLGVEKCASYLAEVLLPGKKFELCVAALLHDVAKELPIDEQIGLVKSAPQKYRREGYISPQVLHSFAAPGLILRDFPELATSDVLSATLKHTVGDGAMSVFDIIIFVSDYIEEGRSYSSSIKIREQLFSALKTARCEKDKRRAL